MFFCIKSDNDLEDCVARMVELTTLKQKPDLFARLPTETMAIDLAGVIAARRGNWQDLCPEGGDGCWGSTKWLNKPAFTPSKLKAYFSYVALLGNDLMARRNRSSFRTVGKRTCHL